MNKHELYVLPKNITYLFVKHDNNSIKRFIDSHGVYVGRYKKLAVYRVGGRLAGASGAGAVFINRRRNRTS